MLMIVVHASPSPRDRRSFPAIAAFMLSPRPGSRVARAGAGGAGDGRAGRERAHPGGQSGDASRADHGARGDGAGIFRPAPGDDRARRVAEAPALRSRSSPASFSRSGSDGPGSPSSGSAAYAAKLGVAAILLGNLRDLDCQDARVSRAQSARSRPDARAARHVSPLCRRGGFDNGAWDDGARLRRRPHVRRLLVLVELPAAVPGPALLR